MRMQSKAAGLLLYFKKHIALLTGQKNVKYGLL